MEYSENSPVSGGKTSSAIDTTARRNTGVGVERYAMDAINKLYYNVWDNSIHFGIAENASVSYEDAIERTKHAIAALLDLSPEKRVLELASGLGETAHLFAAHYGAHVSATNISQQHLQGARERTALAGLDGLVENVWADFHDLPFEDATFDACFVQEALVHARDKDHVAAEVFRVLRPGGRFVLSDQTTRAEWLSAAERWRFVERHGSPDLLDSGGFIAVLERAGFKIVRDDDHSNALALHFERLVTRIEDHHDALCASIEPDVVGWNLDTWRFAANKAREGAIGWHIFLAQRP